ncbi:MAG: septum formation protein Maf [Clostridiales bacterium]|nr:septum formation protein Maf [Clostridiales bacterium]
MRLILASKSPRRRELLSLITSDFTVMSEEVDERGIEEEVLQDGGDAREVQRELARQKAAAVFDALTDEQKKDAIVIGADTSVVCDGQILGKPEDKNDARRMLRMLSGKTHEVITGVCVRTQEKEEVFEEVTRVVFGELDEYQTELIERYIATDEPYDKAGAYGIQQGGALLVDTVEGDYFNVVGLPVRRLAYVLEHFLI